MHVYYSVIGRLLLFIGYASPAGEKAMKRMMSISMVRAMSIYTLWAMHITQPASFETSNRAWEVGKRRGFSSFYPKRHQSSNHTMRPLIQFASDRLLIESSA